MEPVRFAIVGIGGYGKSHLKAIQAVEKEGLAKLAVAIIRSPQKYAAEEKALADQGTRIVRSQQELAKSDRVDIIAIPTGIESHKPQMIQAVRAGYPCLLEKPPTATIQDFDEMVQAVTQTGKFCQIGFQSQSSPSIRSLKRAICDGKLGRIREVVVTASWRRIQGYFTRNPWSGRFFLNGDYILDGTINNPMAHQVFNALYLASQEWNHAASPETVRAELYHANKIESEDNACVELACGNGVRIWFYFTLCAPEQTLPVIDIYGDKARATWTTGTGAIFDGANKIAEFADGTVDSKTEQFRNVVKYVRGEEKELNCPLAMTRPHVLAVNGAFESSGATFPIAEEHLATNKDANNAVSVEVKGIVDLIRRASSERKLFSDLGVPWAKKSKPFSLKGYREFKLKLA